MKIKTTIVLAVLLCGLLLVGGGVWAMSSGNYGIDWDVIGGGGGPASSTNYAVRGTIGQPAVESSFSTNYGLWSGYWYPAVVEVAQIVGETREVNCAILPGVTVTLYQDDIEIDSTVSDGDGNYELAVPDLGDYIVTASKSGFRDKTQTISVSDPTTYALDFVGDYGLVPNAPNMSYVLACINLWKFGTPPCNLNMSTVLAVINAWKFPI